MNIQSNSIILRAGIHPILFSHRDSNADGDRCRMKSNAAVLTCSPSIRYCELPQYAKRSDFTTASGKQEPMCITSWPSQRKSRHADATTSKAAATRYADATMCCRLDREKTTDEKKPRRSADDGGENRNARCGISHAFGS